MTTTQSSSSCPVDTLLPSSSSSKMPVLFPRRNYGESSRVSRVQQRSSPLLLSTSTTSGTTTTSTTAFARFARTAMEGMLGGKCDSSSFSSSTVSGTTNGKTTTDPSKHVWTSFDDVNDDEEEDFEEDEEEEEEDNEDDEKKNNDDPQATTAAAARVKGEKKKKKAPRRPYSPPSSLLESSSSHGGKSPPVASSARDPAPVGHHVTPTPSWTAQHASSRRSRQYFSTLPTLDETSSSDTDDDDDPSSSSHNFEEDDQLISSSAADMMMMITAQDHHHHHHHPNRNNSSSNPQAAESSPGSPSKRKKGSSKRSTSTPTTQTESTLSNSTSVSSLSASSMSSSLSATTATTTPSTSSRTGGHGGSSKTFQDRVMDLQSQAQRLAGLGREEEALSVYKKAIKMNRVETSRIKMQLKQVAGKHPSTIHSIASRLYEDWLNVGTNIANLRLHMAVLYADRLGDYPRARTCCAEARGVYQRQVHFLERKQREVVGVAAAMRAVQPLVDRFTRAHESFAARKQLHEEMMVVRRALTHVDPRTKEEDDDHCLFLCSRLDELSQQALALESETLGREHPQVADTLSLLATVAVEQGRIDRAERYLNEAMAIAHKTLGPQHPLTGEITLQMARVKASQHHPSSDTTTTDAATSTLQYYEDALENFRRVNTALLSTVLNEIAVLKIRRKQYAPAVDMLNEAVLVSESPHDSLIQVYRNMGECYSHLRDYPKAVNAFVHALDKLRETQRQRLEPTTTTHNDGSVNQAGQVQRSEDLPPCHLPLVDEDTIAETARRLGKAYMGCGQHTEAMNSFNDALMIHRSSVLKAVNPVDGKPNEGLPERQDQLAHTLFCIAEAREAMGEYSEAERMYSESMQLRLFSDAHRANKRQNMIHCAMCLRGIGIVHMSRNEYDIAKGVFDDALRYCEGHGLPDKHVILASIRHKRKDAIARQEEVVRLREVHSQLETQRHEILQLEQAAQLQIANGDFGNATDTLTQLMSSRKQCMKLMKANKLDFSNEKIETAYTLKVFGKVLIKRGDKMNAERAFTDALKLFRKGDGNDQVAIEEIKKLLESLRVGRADI